MPSDSEPSLPLAVWQTIERLCTDYERALRTGESVALESLLPHVPPEAQPVLRRELEAVAAEYRSGPLAEKSTQTHIGDAAVNVDTATVIGDIPSGAPPLEQHPRYRLLRCLGHGSRCVTWQAEDRLLRRSVVLRCLHAQRLSNPELVTKFTEHVQQMLSWRDAHIAAVYEVELYGGSTLVVGEWVEGTPLTEHLASDNKLTVSAACATIHAALLGVQFAANQQASHGHLVPKSLVRTVNGLTKIVDYSLTPLETTLDPLYAAPERLAGAAADVRADIYSLGCILTAFLTKPGEHIPSKLMHIVEKMSAARPADRFVSAAEAAKALRPWTVSTHSLLPMRLWWAAKISLSLFLLLLWTWQTVDSQQVRTIFTSDPHVEVGVREGLVISARDPIENRDYPIAGLRLILAHAFRDAGLRIPLVNGTSMRLRRDGEEWIIIRATEIPTVVEPTTRPSPTSPQDRRDPLPFQEVHDFREGHDLDLQTLRSWVKGLPKEFTVVDINSRAHSDPPRFNVLALRYPNPVTVRIDWELTDDEIKQSFEQNDGNTWALLSIAPYVKNGRRYAQLVWERDRAVWAWQSRYWNDIPGVLEGARKDKMRPICISLNPPPARSGVTTIGLRPDHGLEWKCDFDLTADQLEWKIKLARENGWQPDALAAYDDGTGRGTLYSVITVSNPSAAKWEFRHDLDINELEKTIDDLRTERLRPKVITSETTTTGRTRHNGIWVEYAPPQPKEVTTFGPASALDAIAAARSMTVGEVRRFEGFAERSWICRCAFTPDGKHVLATLGSIHEWEAATGRKVATYAKTSPYGWGLDVSPDGGFVVTAGDDAQLYLWNRKTQRNLMRWSMRLSGPYGFESIFSPDGRSVLAWSHRGNNLTLWDWRQQTLLRTFETMSPHGGACFSADGKWVLAGGADSVVRVWNTDTGELRHNLLGGHTQGIRDVACTPDGKYAVSASADHSLLVWDLETGWRVRELKGHTESVLKLAIASDCRRVFSGGADRTARVWDLETGQPMAVFEANTIPGATPSVSDVQISPDGKYGLTCAFDGTVRLWRLPELPAVEKETRP